MKIVTYKGVLMTEARMKKIIEIEERAKKKEVKEEKKSFKEKTAESLDKK